MMKDRTLLRRFGAMTMTLMLTLSLMATPTFAAGDGTGDPETPPGQTETLDATNTVTVNGAVKDATYKLYKLLQLETKTEDNKTEEGISTGKKIVAYQYSYDAALDGIIHKVLAMDGFKLDESDDGSGYGFKVTEGQKNMVTFVTPGMDGTSTSNKLVEDDTIRSMMVKFADALRVEIEAAGATLTAFDEQPADSETVTFAGVPNGYWMVTSTAGARSVIFTSPEEADIAQDVEINEKNQSPTVDKFVYDHDAAGTNTGELADGAWKESNDASIGDTVTFKIEADLYRGSENIIVHDTMSKGLTFNEGSVRIKFSPRLAQEDGTIKDVYGREVYENGRDGATTTGPLELTGKTDLYTAEATVNEDGTTTLKIRLSNTFTNPAERNDNPLNNLFLGKIGDMTDDGGKIEIQYTAVLNEEAVIGAAGNSNTVKVKYGHISGVNPGEDPEDPDGPEGPEEPDEPDNETPPDETKTYTYEFNIDKHVMGAESAKLAGATFQLIPYWIYAGNGDRTPVTGDDANGYSMTIANPYKDTDAALQLIDITGSDAGGDKVYRVAKYDAETKTYEDGAITDMVTGSTGKITIQGLDSMLYAIKETEAPAGYNKLEKPVMMAIGSTLSGQKGVVFEESKAEAGAYKSQASDTVKIANASGIRMPDTGGIGTTIFYIGGGVLVLAAGALLVVKKRTGRTED